MKREARPSYSRVGEFNQPRGVALDAFGNIIVADTGSRRVVSILAALPAWTMYLPLAANGQ